MNTDSAPEDAPCVLVVDDDPDIRKSATLLLSRRGYRSLAAATIDEAWSHLAQQPVDILLLDLNFTVGRTDGAEGLGFLRQLVAYDDTLAVVVVTGHSGINVAVAAMRAGAHDFVIKPWNNARFAATIDAAAMERRRQLSVRAAPGRSPDSVVLLGESPAVGAIRALIERVAPTGASVLVTGPAGSGKSLIARLIHRASRDVSRPLAVLDLAALDRVGAEPAIASAIDGMPGTLVLDHLDRLPTYARSPLAASLQRADPKLRLIATARDRARLSGPEGPGSDNMERLGVIEIAVPLLSARGRDSVRLGQHFLRVAALRHGILPRELSAEAEAAVVAADWPDGVRGLALAMERAAILANGARVEPTDLKLDAAPAASLLAENGGERSLAAAERAAVESALRRYSFNVTQAARELGITRAALYRRMARHGI